MSEQALQTIQRINEHMHAMMRTDPLEITSFGSTIDTIFSRLDNTNVVLYMLHSLFGDMDRLVKLTTLWLRRHRGNDQLGTATALSMQAYVRKMLSVMQEAPCTFTLCQYSQSSFALRLFDDIVVPLVVDKDAMTPAELKCIETLLRRAGAGCSVWRKITESPHITDHYEYHDFAYPVMMAPSTPAGMLFRRNMIATFTLVMHEGISMQLASPGQRYAQAMFLKMLVATCNEAVETSYTRAFRSEFRVVAPSHGAMREKMAKLGKSIRDLKKLAFIVDETTERMLVAAPHQQALLQARERGAAAPAVPAVLTGGDGTLANVYTQSVVTQAQTQAISLPLARAFADKTGDEIRAEIVRRADIVEKLEPAVRVTLDPEAAGNNDYTEVENYGMAVEERKRFETSKNTALAALKSVSAVIKPTMPQGSDFCTDDIDMFVKLRLEAIHSDANDRFKMVMDDGTVVYGNKIVKVCEAFMRNNDLLERFEREMDRCEGESKLHPHIVNMERERMSQSVPSHMKVKLAYSSEQYCF